jgi:RTX calcium-binding nonapeptide repeat (4 copies)
MLTGPGAKACLALAVAVLTVPSLLADSARAEAPVTCTLVSAGAAGPADDVLKLVDRAADVTSIYRKGDEIVIFNNLDSKPTACAGGVPTVFNIDRIEYLTAAGTPFIDFSGTAALAPGASPEVGAAEIEVEISESYEPKVLNVGGTAAAERIEVGQLGSDAIGVNLDAQADGSAQDADIVLAAPAAEDVVVRAIAKGGDDTVSALGGPAFTGPVAAERLSLTGGPGNDRLLGGPGNDFLSGDDGNDLLLGGRGRDRLAIGSGRDLAKGGKGADQIENRDFGSGDDLSPDHVFGGQGDDNIDVAQGLAGDRIDCGSGVDRLAIDPGDKASACEQVDTIHR